MRAALLFLLSAAAMALAKPLLGAPQRGAPDYYHGAAYKYVAGRMQEAAIEAEEGLRIYPNDAALKALVDQLKKMKDQQKKDQGSGGASQGESGEQDKDKKDSQNDQGQEEKEQPEQEKERDKGGDKSDEKDKQPPPESGAEDKNKDAGDSTGETKAPVKPGEMSKEDAERLLNSFQDDEKKEHRQMQRARKKLEVEQDW